MHKGLAIGALSLVGATLAGAAQAQMADPGNQPSSVPGLSMRDLAVRGVPGGGGQVLVPQSSIAVPGETGVSHTQHLIFVPDTPPMPLNSVPTQSQATPTVGTPYPGEYYETPASLACVYQMVTPDQNGFCDPNTVTTVATGGSNAIAVVDAYHYANALADLQAYSAQFGLPAPNLQVIYAQGSEPVCPAGKEKDCAGWNSEAALDLQMAHAMAPNAKLILVETANNNNANLYAGVVAAANAVQAAGGGQVSMSFASAEGSDTANIENTYIGTLTNKSVVFFASTGDNPGVRYPSTSPNVIAVGGTSISRSTAVPANRGRFREETAWQKGGGGYSTVFPRPTYQNGIAGRLGPNNGMRVVPDISAMANPSTGAIVRVNGEWNIIGGTSASSPLMAGMVNSAGAFRANSAQQLAFMYSQIGTPAYFDVARGTCGVYDSMFVTSKAVEGGGTNALYQYDFCTGLGTPRGKSGL